MDSSYDGIRSSTASAAFDMTKRPGSALKVWSTLAYLVVTVMCFKPCISTYREVRLVRLSKGLSYVEDCLCRQAVCLVAEPRQPLPWGQGVTRQSVTGLVR